MCKERWALWMYVGHREWCATISRGIFGMRLWGSWGGLETRLNHIAR